MISNDGAVLGSATLAAQPIPGFVDGLMTSSISLSSSLSASAPARLFGSPSAIFNASPSAVLTGPDATSKSDRVA